MLLIISTQKPLRFLLFYLLFQPFALEELRISFFMGEPLLLAAGTEGDFCCFVSFLRILALKADR